MLVYFSFSYAVRFLKIVPTLLMLYVNNIQLSISINMRQRASFVDVADISPNPTVSIIFIAQQQDHIYFSGQHKFCKRFFVNQFYFGLSPAIIIRRTLKICAKKKFMRKIFTSCQYCSLQKFFISTISRYLIFSKTCINFKARTILHHFTHGRVPKQSSVKISKTIKSKIKPFFRQASP